jgi:hypothetical protein
MDPKARAHGVIRMLSAAFCADLRPFVDMHCEQPLIRALVSIGLVEDAYDCYLRLPQNSNPLPRTLLTDILLAFYRKQARDQFHLAYDEMCSRGYNIGAQELRLLAKVVPSSVLQSLMGQDAYITILREIQIQTATRQRKKANVSAHKKDNMIQDGQTTTTKSLDLRFVPPSLVTKLLWLSLHDLGGNEFLIETRNVLCSITRSKYCK